MSLYLFAYTVPAVGVLKVLSLVSPKTYLKFEQLPISKRSDLVNAIVEEVFEKENVVGSEYYDRLQDMFKEMPKSDKEIRIKDLLRLRLKVIDAGDEQVPYFSAGSDTDTNNGKYYIGITPEDNPEILPAIVTHELYHILNDDNLFLAALKTTASVAITTFGLFTCGWSVVSTICATAAMNAVTHAFYANRSEDAADAFAFKHCTKAQLVKMKEYFMTHKTNWETLPLYKKVIKRFLHPSDEVRIANIEAAIQSKR